MMRISFILLGACAVLGASQPVDNLPILKQLTSEMLFRDNKELVVECVTEGKEVGVSYKWLKEGQPLTPNAEIIQRDNEGTLIFKNPSKKDEGKYQCLAESKYGVSTTRVNLRRMYIDNPKVDLKRHKPVEGKMYKLDCEIPNSYPKPEIVWLYQSLSDPSASRNILDRRITLSPEGDLYFSNVTKEDTSDSFKYVCVGRTPASDADVVLAEHVLEDIVPNSGARDNEVYPQYVTNDFTALIGSVTMIYCIYGGTPLAYPDWYKDGKNVNNEPKDRVTRYNRTSGKRLLIKETWLEDQGNYTCIVDNEVGNPQHHSMHLNVVSAPDFTKQPEQKLIVQSGKDITVHCQIAGVPLPKVSWTHNTKDLAKRDRVHIEHNTQGNVTVADLIIKNVQGTDAGYYGCRGENFNGEVYAESLVVVQ
ncbi:hemolin-like [Maniola hyperantus]|uniref:hemolin-like n=1 Tax=Aphantopus hyperantus TaxID=2795564 RepID=UPI00156994F9|nr:hemolin-like [Maniola hyperantus]